MGKCLSSKDYKYEGCTYKDTSDKEYSTSTTITYPSDDPSDDPSDEEDSTSTTIPYSHIESSQHQMEVIPYSNLQHDIDAIGNDYCNEDQTPVVITYSERTQSSNNSLSKHGNQTANNHSSNGSNNSNGSPNDNDDKQFNENNNNPNRKDQPDNHLNGNDAPFCNIRQHEMLTRTVTALENDVDRQELEYKALSEKFYQLEVRNNIKPYDLDQKREEFDEKKLEIKKIQRITTGYTTGEFMGKRKLSVTKGSRYNDNQHQGFTNRSSCKSQKLIASANVHKVSSNMTSGRNNVDVNNHWDKFDDTSDEKGKEQKIINDSNKININKYFTTKILPNKAKEKFIHPDQYMKQFELFYGDQFMNWYCNGTLGIINYNIHKKHSGESLYVVYKKQHNKNTNCLSFTQIDCYTVSELKQQYPEIISELKSKPLPKICQISDDHDLKPNVDVMININNVLKDRDKRQQLFENTKWTKFDVHQWNHGAKEAVLITYPKEAFVDNLHSYLQQQAQLQTDNTLNALQLITIVSPDTNKMEYAVKIPFVTRSAGRIKFHVAVSFASIDDSKSDNDAKEISPDEDSKSSAYVDGVKVSGIFLNIYDEHQLVQAHHQNKECKILEDFHCNIYLKIDGIHKMIQLEKNYKNVKQEKKKLIQEKRQLEHSNTKLCQEKNEWMQEKRELELNIKQLYQEKMECVREKLQQAQYFQKIIKDNQIIMNGNQIILDVNHQLMAQHQ